MNSVSVILIMPLLRPCDIIHAPNNFMVELVTDIRYHDLPSLGTITVNK